MRISTIILLIGLVAGFIFGAIGITLIIGFENTPKVVAGYTYEGKALLSQADYEQLKEVVAREDVVIHELETHNSNPVLVIFSIDTPANVSTFWGKQTAHTTYSAPEAEQVLYIGRLTCGSLALALGCILTLLWRAGN